MIVFFSQGGHSLPKGRLANSGGVPVAGVAVAQLGRSAGRSGQICDATYGQDRDGCERSGDRERRDQLRAAAQQNSEQEDSGAERCGEPVEKPFHWVHLLWNLIKSAGIVL